MYGALGIYSSSDARAPQHSPLPAHSWIGAVAFAAAAASGVAADHRVRSSGVELLSFDPTGLYRQSPRGVVRFPAHLLWPNSDRSIWGSSRSISCERARMWAGAAGGRIASQQQSCKEKCSSRATTCSPAWKVGNFIVTGHAPTSSQHWTPSTSRATLLASCPRETPRGWC